MNRARWRDEQVTKKKGGTQSEGKVSNQPGKTGGTEGEGKAIN